MSCGTADKVNCPQDPGPDYDMGSSPILSVLADGKRFVNGAAVDDDPWREIWLPSDVAPIPARLAVYDRELMRELRKRAPTMVAIALGACWIGSGCR